jgi:hypothetical protein
VDRNLEANAMVYLETLSWHFPGETEKKMKNEARILSNLAEILTGYIGNISYCYTNLLLDITWRI